jgi:hypothetical protein
MRTMRIRVPDELYFTLVQRYGVRYLSMGVTLLLRDALRQRTLADNSPIIRTEAQFNIRHDLLVRLWHFAYTRGLNPSEALEHILEEHFGRTATLGHTPKHQNTTQ